MRQSCDTSSSAIIVFVNEKGVDKIQRFNENERIKW